MTDVDLKEFLEHKIEALDKRIDERINLRDYALVLQAKDYERRLDALNHMQALLKDERAHFMPREVSDMRWESMDVWRERITIQLANGAGRHAVFTAIWAAVVSLGIVGISKLL